MTYKEEMFYKKANLNKNINRSINIFATILVCFSAFLMIFPYFYMIISSLKTQQEILGSTSLLKNFFPKNPNWHIFVEIFTGNDRYSLRQFNFLDSVKNTLIIEVLVIPIGSFVSALAAFAFAKMKFKGKNVILMVLLVSMMIPYAAVMLPQFRVWRDMKLVNTLWPLIIPGLFGNMGMMLFLITTIKSSIPDSLIEESRVEGVSWFGTFIKVVLPLIKPALVAQMLFWFVGIWNDFFGPSIYLTDPSIKTVQVLIMGLNSTAGAEAGDMPFVMAASFISSLPIILLFIIMNKSFVQTNANSGIKG
jgi:multiple sugar transport system permease protein